MLITLCYVYLWVRFNKCYSLLIRNSLSKLSNSKSGFSFSFCSATEPEAASGPCTRRDNIFLQIGNRGVYVTKPQVCDDISNWTLLLGSALVCGPQIESVSFIIEAAGRRGRSSPLKADKKVLKWSDYCLPLASSPGQPFRAVALASTENFCRLGVAFIEDRLQLEDGLSPSKIVPVLLQDDTWTQLLEKQSLRSSETVRTPSQCSRPVVPQLLPDPYADQHSYRKGSLLIVPEVRKVEERRGSEPLPCTQDLGPVRNGEENLLGNHNHMEGHGHHLHLSSCNECLELENSTILSVKYTSAENIPDLPDDSSAGVDSVDEDEAEFDAKEGGTDASNSKPPNVLVYCDGSLERFQIIHQLLLESINVENIVIYPLEPQQALTDPWLENTRLLVLAEEESLSPELQTRILTYLNQGGKVLGLCSSLCPAGLHLESRERQRMEVRRLRFTREDSTELELSILASGHVYTRDPQGGGEVELWGELKGDIVHQRDMVIIRMTHGGDGGEAVLCQVHFDVAPGSQGLDSEAFDRLKVSNALRYEVLTEILTFLGFSCEPNQTPAPSPVHLLAVSQEAKTGFLKWAQARAENNGTLTFPKTSFRIMSASDLRDAPQLPEGPLALVTDSAESQDWTQFNMETYRKHLKTKHLAHALLYSEVVTSTMDLLDGMSVQLPQEVGVIAVAARQTQGKGRGRNAWLSPPGCAMFTLRLQVELSSRLGQRISFLQHLVALAVVEAVCTLPGYEDIDLKVKWPNDIYYGNLMKLGGVLVTSTLTGSTFYLLAGCGFNVSNSNPTVCINDLIQQHNKLSGRSLEELSCSQLIARTVTCLDELIGKFQHGGPDAVLATYYRRWLHSGTRVRLWSEEGPEAQVMGLDENGFLQVLSKEQGLVSVEPDGNSFDMLKNLVVMKQR